MQPSYKSRPTDRAAHRAGFLYGGFFVVGFATVLLGPLIPELEERWGLTAAQAGWLFVAQFVASSVGSVLSSVDLRRSVLIGYAAIAGGLALLAFGGWALALPAMTLLGLGLGFTAPATNLLVAARNPRRRGAALAKLNLFWGLGAVGCPLLFAALGGRVPTPALLVAMALAAALLVAVLFGAGSARAPAAAPGAEAQLASLADSFRPLLPGALMLGLYVGAEITFGGWLVSLARGLDPGRPTLALLIGALFWAAFLLSRGSASWILSRLSEPRLYALSLALSIAGTVVVLVSDHLAPLTAGAVLAGAGLAPLYPLTVSIIAADSEAAGAGNAGWVFAFAGVGGALLPWLTGRLTELTGSLGLSFLVPLTGLALLAALFAWHRPARAGGAAQPPPAGGG